jgi:hypothetical protein
LSEPRTRTFYRLAHDLPPRDEDYTTAREKRGGRDPKPGSPADLIYSWDSLSAFDSEEAARQTGRKYPRLGQVIVRYHVPDDSGIEARQFGEDRHHYDLRGGADWARDLPARKALMERFLDRDYRGDVHPPDRPQDGSRP